MKFESLAIAFLSSATAFSPAKSNRVGSMKTEAALVTEVDEAPRIIYDPLGLYPNDALERATGLIQPFVGSLEQDDKAVIDPLSIYQDKAELTKTVAMSASVPFLQRPEMLDGSLPGDRGFDPFNFSSTPEALQWYRNSELKHARLAMLAAAGWPLAELFHKNVASGFDMQSLLNVQDRVPSVLNGGLSKVPPAFWIATLAASAVIEGAANSGEKQSGDFGFDPLGLGGKSEEQKRFMLEAELFNGRLGMLAITGFAIQEWFTQDAVVNAIPIFFKPFNVAFEQLMDAGANSL